MAGISRRLLANAVHDRLATVSNVTLYRGEVTGTVATIPDSGGRVKPYLVEYFSPGTPSADQDLGDEHEDLDWLIQVTCVAGYDVDLFALIDRVDDALYRWAPVIAGVQCSGLKPPLGFDPGPIRRDPDVTPNRLYVPLQYRTLATT